MKISIKIIFLTFFFVISNSVKAEQHGCNHPDSTICYFKENAQDGDLFKIKISRNEISRISSFGETKLTDLYGAEKDITVKPEPKKGQFFIKPKKNSKNISSFFVKDDTGNTYTVIAEHLDIASQTLIIKPKIIKKKTEAKQYVKNSDSHTKKIKDLIRMMWLDSGPKNGYSKESLSLITPVWFETRILLIKRYVGREFVGEIYEIENIDSKPINFDESEFLGLGENVKAVSLAKLKLKPLEKSKLFIIRSAGVINE